MLGPRAARWFPNHRAASTNFRWGPSTEDLQAALHNQPPGPPSRVNGRRAEQNRDDYIKYEIFADDVMMSQPFFCSAQLLLLMGLGGLGDYL